MVAGRPMIIPFDNTYARLPEAFFARVAPTPVRAPRLIAFNRELAGELGMEFGGFDDDAAAEIFSGNRVPDGAEPIAMAYSGHQFGGFSPMLGDGRAILLGEVVGRDGRRRDIQLKGSGPTPFSRRGDGRSALGPVLREYLVSEAMHALGVPTTRALAAVWSGEVVHRETPEPGGVFTRVAASHLRVGTMEYFAARGDHANLCLLVEHAIARHDPAAADASVPALALLEGIIERQARLIARWMGLGFIHGVMNTDNTSLSGETIDYGPCAFLDAHDPGKKFSYIDSQGRYAYGNQPAIGHWNLTRLAEALLPLLDDQTDKAVDLARDALDRFPESYRAARVEIFAAKIGVASGDEKDWPVIRDLLDLMARDAVDFTLAFRRLTVAAGSGEPEGFLTMFASRGDAAAWWERCRAHWGERSVAPAEAAAVMRGANPVFIPRNHRIEEAIVAGRSGDFEPFHRLRRVLARPYDEQPESADLERPPRPDEEVAATFCGT